LWEGLVVPSGDAWARGAAVLSDAPLEPERLTPGQTPVPQIGVLTEAVHKLGREALRVGAGQRGEVYAELLTTCGSCHRWLGGGADSSVR
jgi:hypothetical protein